MITEKLKQERAKAEGAFSEDKIQADCIRWLWNAYPKTRGLLYHIPNGGKRSARTGAILKAMGVIAGIPDLCLAVPTSPNMEDSACVYLTSYGALYVEMKTDDGKLSSNQIDSIQALLRAGNKVVECRSLEDFKDQIHEYLKGTKYLQP